MKLSKIFAGMSAAAIMAAAAVMPASAAKQIDCSTLSDGWGISDGLAKRILVGSDTDNPAMTRDDQAKLHDITTVRVSISGEGSDTETWGTGGSIVVQGANTGWGQHDFSVGAWAMTTDDPTVLDTSKNADLKIYRDGGKYTIEYSDPEGIFKAEDVASTENYYGICVQNFDAGSDTTSGDWSIVGFDLLGADGTSIYSEGDTTFGDEFTGVKPDTGDESTTDSSTDSKTDSTSDSKTDSTTSSTTSSSTTSSAASTTSSKAAGGSTTSSKAAGGSTTSTATSSAASDATESPEAGAAAGIALALAAVAGAAVVVSKKR